MAARLRCVETSTSAGGNFPLAGLCPPWSGLAFPADEREIGSFDGRYFGVSKQADVIGKARLLWAR
jgi:hypothetical protein